MLSTVSKRLGSTKSIVQSYNAVSTTVTDPLWSAVICGLHMDGVNTGTTFIDSRNAGTTVAAGGNAQISTAQSMFGGSSATFDGTGDYITVSNLPSIGTGDFCIEYWYRSAGNGISRAQFAGSGPMAYMYHRSDGYYVYYNAGDRIVTPTILSANVWYHIAVERVSGVITLYINGTSTGTWADATNFTSTIIYIGNDASVGTGTNGWIDDFRMTRSARYKGNFTPLGVAFPTTDGAIADPYWANVVMLQHFEGGNGGTNFVDQRGRVPATINGNAITSTNKSVFGTSCLYLDGVGDAVSYSASTDFQFGSGDFTIECWVNPSSYPAASSYYSILSSVQATNAGSNWDLMMYNTGQIYGGIYSSTTWVVTITTPSIPLNQWTHIAFVRFGVNFYVFLNGVLGGTNANAGAMNANSNLINIGSDAVLTVRNWPGYIDELRITKGVARYVSNFAVPTAPFYDGNTSTNDSLWSSVTSLLHFDGAVGGAIVDSKNTSRVVTKAGNADLSSTVMRFGSTSCYFDGTGDWITLDGSSDYVYGTNDFTIEFWVNLTSIPGTYGTFYDHRAAAEGIYPTILISSGVPVFWVNGAARITHTTTLVANTWYHIAVSRTGSSTQLFVNGIVGGGVFTDTNSYLTNASKPQLGANNSGGQTITGYIDDFRVTKGVGRYAGNFIVPTSQFYDGNTYVPVSVTTPDDPYWGDTSFLMHFDGINGSTMFADQRNHAVAAYGNSVISTNKSKFGASSAYFDGSGDYITTTGGADFTFGTGDYTIEFWCNRLVSGVQHYLFSFATAAGDLAPSLWIDATNVLIFYLSGARITGTATIAINTWYHIALVRIGGVTKLFVNGVQDGSSFTDANNYATVAGTRPIIGAAYDSTTSMNGYIDEFRVTKGVGRYTNSFSVPTAPFYDGTNTSSDPYYYATKLLCHFDGADSSASFIDLRGHTGTGYGTALLKTAQSRFGASSLNLVSAGDYVQYATNTDFDFGNGDFTVEAWVYCSTIGTTERMITEIGNHSTSAGLAFYIGTAGDLRVFTAAAVAISGGTAVTAATWNHVALVRAGSSLKTYLNGVNVGSATNSAALASTTYGVCVGRDVLSSASQFVGYIDELRITKGVARYQANFIPQTTAFIGA